VKMGARRAPLCMTWCQAPGKSMRGFLAIEST
jgi:hypothetical protein